MWKVYVDGVDPAVFSQIFPVAQQPVKELLSCIDTEGLDAIILFGSSVSDHCTQDSDVDVAVLSQLPEEEVAYKINLRGFGKEVDILIFTELIDNGINSVEHDILTEGVILWEK